MSLKCLCPNCRGSGKITCDECDGEGAVFCHSIETARLDETDPKYADLIEFQRDARRVISQTKQLKVMNPARSESYDAQLNATLAEINKQAETVANRKAP